MLQCKNLTIGYQGHPVLENLNFAVESGDYFCIMGENGAGKSTLMKTLIGLIPPLSGEIIMENPKELGYLPQQTARQKDFPATVWEIVLSGCLSGIGLRPFYNKAEKQRAKDAMERLGISNLSKRCYRELSGGQQERVLLARALCCSGKMLLLDEPTSGLDPSITEELYQLLGDLHQKEKVTLIVISHDLSASLRYANKILSLGRNSFFGTKEEYTQWEHHCKVCELEGEKK
ncbi:MAG: ABC transporter ATP-binding protein [Eubacteriales bacterium]